MISKKLSEQEATDMLAILSHPRGKRLVERKSLRSCTDPHCTNPATVHVRDVYTAWYWALCTRHADYDTAHFA